jgi:hypothetical protein
METQRKLPGWAWWGLGALMFALYCVVTVEQYRMFQFMASMP